MIMIVNIGPVSVLSQLTKTKSEQPGLEIKTNRIKLNYGKVKIRKKILISCSRLTLNVLNLNIFWINSLF